MDISTCISAAEGGANYTRLVLLREIGGVGTRTQALVVMTRGEALLLCVPVEIGILGHSCDVVKPGSLLKTVLIHFPSSVLISSDLARFLPALLV